MFGHADDLGDEVFGWGRLEVSRGVELMGVQVRSSHGSDHSARGDLGMVEYETVRGLEKQPISVELRSRGHAATSRIEPTAAKRTSV